jgi:DNA polymerase-3 subunit alpha
MDLLDELKSILGSFPGEVPVVLQLTTAQGRHRLKVGNRYRVEPVSGLYAELKCLLGESCVRVGR